MDAQEAFAEELVEREIVLKDIWRRHRKEMEGHYSRSSSLVSHQEEKDQNSQIIGYLSVEISRRVAGLLQVEVWL